ncbi:class I and II aminotransferase [[Clostridium] cellulosi]|jgi:Aminotransferase class I and II.|uniref:Histidinol-phosphate aminotransferase n=1 Tax=[Clostridium] cellulosi TaxID=29343 RepID=A0A078KKE2_9FIRM|nr:class I and II aminotransferase [[Clostridium] cellulosi]
MNDFICNKLKRLTPYEPGINDCAIHLDANESCMELTDEMKRKIGEKMLDLHFNRYPDPLATEVCELFGARYNVPARFITAGNGSDELISLLFGVFVEQGEKVLITEPDFSMYKIYCSTYECKPVILNKNDDFSFSPDEMIELANKEKVRLIIFSNPCNPTGQGISRDDVLKIVENSHCLVVVDEAYMDFWDQSVIDCAPAAKNLIVLRTCSKIGFAAGRLGFAIANSELTDYFRSAKSPYNVNSLTQAAASVFLGEKDYLPGAIDAIKRSRDRLYKALKKLQERYNDKMHVYETHTNFVLVRFNDSKDVCEKLKAFGISVRLISGCLRITAGTEAENRTLIGTLEKILEHN